MKTPVTYYGGKTRMLKHILPLIPEHRIYVEPFFGGGAVYFAKEPARNEVINDNLDYVITFWEVLQTDYRALKARIRASLHSERLWSRSREVLRDPERHSRVTRAWAFWVQAQMSFSHKPNGGFAFSKAGQARATANKIRLLTREHAARLRNTQIFCRDALDVIRRFDGPETFFYLDPPYAESDCGSYEKGKDVYYQLLELLPTLQGRWLLSSYPSEELDRVRAEVGAHSGDVTKSLAVNGKQNRGKRKVECLTWNYQV